MRPPTLVVQAGAVVRVLFPLCFIKQVAQGIHQTFRHLREITGVMVLPRLAQVIMQRGAVVVRVELVKTALLAL
jgi:hypothetical protein